MILFGDERVRIIAKAALNGTGAGKGVSGGSYREELRGRAQREFRAYLARNEAKFLKLVARRTAGVLEQIGYADIRAALEAGQLDASKLQAFREEYAKYVAEVIAPAWKQAMQEAAQEISARYPAFYFDITTPEILEWAQQRAAGLVVKVTDDVRGAISQAVTASLNQHEGATGALPGGSYGGFSVDELAEAVRPMVGLYPQQVKANLSYMMRMQASLTKGSTRLSAALASGDAKRVTAAQKAINAQARHAAIRYAEKQHRYRSMMIARTELAAAYNTGKFQAIHQAQHLMGRTVKTWLTAADGRTCDLCARLEGVSVDLDAPFTSAIQGRPSAKSYSDWMVPPLHPQCRCSVVYEEVEAPEAIGKSCNQSFRKFNHNHDEHGRFASGSSSMLPKSNSSGTINNVTDHAKDSRYIMSGIYTLGKIDVDVYKCVNDAIDTDEVIITEERLEHIRERHPDDYTKHLEYLTECIEFPDYILRDNDPCMAVVLKHVRSIDENFRVIIKVHTISDEKGRKNSIITFLSISEKKWNKYLRNKEILYRRE